MDAKRKKKLITGVVLLLWIVFMGMWVATQELAKSVQYDPLLGNWIFVIAGTPIYWPFRFLTWWLDFGFVIPDLFEAASNSIYVSFIVGMFAFAMIAKRKKPIDSHGSAVWATVEDTIRAKLNDEDGIILGRSPFGKQEEGKNFLRHNGPEHAIVMAPTRSGKGICVIIPTLLTWKHSVLVTDIKGENWGLTAGYRQKHLNNLVLKFDPTAQDGSSVRYNPLAEIRIRTKNEMRDVQNVADMLVDPDGKGQMDHWAKTGHALLVGVITHLMYAYLKEGKGNPSLSDVASFLSRRDAGFDESLAEMKEYAHITGEEVLSETNVLRNIYMDKYGMGLDIDSVIKDFKDNIPYVRSRVDGKSTGIIDYEADDRIKLLMTHPMVAGAAAELQNKSDNEKSGVLSTAMSFLGLYRDPVVAANTSGSEFSVEDLMRDDKPVSLYIVVPPSDISRTRPLIRMILNFILRRLTEKMEFKNGQQVKKKQRLLLLLDEFPALGNLDSMESGLAFIAGYGLKALLIVQSLNQLNKIYTKDNSIVDNCHLRVFFTPNDSETPKFISQMLGKKTIEVTSHSGQTSSVFDKSRSTSQMGRELMTAEEVSQLPYEKEVVFVTGFPPVMGNKLFYYNEKFFQARLMNAPDKSDVCRLVGVDNQN